MKPFVSGIIGTIIGAGIGFGVGFYIGKKKQIEQSDLDLAEMDAYYKEKYGLTASDKKREKAVEPKPEKTEEKPAKGAEMLRAEKFKTFDQIAPVKAPIEEYTKKYHTTIERKEDTDLDEHIVPDEEMTEIENEIRMAAEYQCMVIISPEEWETDEEYDKNEVTYWEADEAFTDVDGVQLPYEILSPDRVGRVNLEKFGITGEDGVLYVRDDANQEDFKIYLEEGSYGGGEA